MGACQGRVLGRAWRESVRVRDSGCVSGSRVLGRAWMVGESKGEGLGACQGLGF